MIKQLSGDRGETPREIVDLARTHQTPPSQFLAEVGRGTTCGPKLSLVEQRNHNIGSFVFTLESWKYLLDCVR